MIQVEDPARAEARLPYWMAAVALAAGVAMLASGHTRWAAGFFLGGTLAILNYYWLREAIVALFDAARVRVPRRLILKFLVRYPLVFGSVYLFYHTGWLPFDAVLAGLFVPTAGVVMEAVIQVGSGLRST
ncbi:MAG TPA: ATP synthase subunit I [Terriglobia bacterium]|nr:ATP synthase subunit I [Terriglobia bacterium]